MNNKTVRTSILVAAFLLLPSLVHAADVYVKIGGTRTSGKSTPGDWSNANAYPDIVAHGFPAMSAGDTMTIDDGAYIGNNNLMNQGSAFPPSGTSLSAMTTIKARHIPCDGATTCASPLLVSWGNPTDPGDYCSAGLCMLGPGNGFHYIKFQGLRLYNTQIMEDWDHIYFKQCSFIGTMSGNSMSYSSDGTNILMEDSVVMGSGRYQTISHADATNGPVAVHNVFRRVVARKDYSNKNNQATMPMGIFTSYGTADDAYLNSIAIDSDQPANYANQSIEYGGAFFYGAGGTGASVLGSISINNAWSAIAFGTHNSNDPGNRSAVIRDFAAIKNAGGPVVSDGTVNRATIYNTGTNLFSGWRSGQLATMYDYNNGFAPWGSTFGPITNSIVKGSQGYAAAAAYGDIIGSFWNTYSNTGGTFGSGVAITGTNQTYNPSVNGLLYPVRVETGSALATAGSGSGQMGANILKRIGHDGDFNGMSGWNVEQPTDLWPWPYEDWIKAEFAAMPATLGGKAMSSPTRGFASPTAKRLDGVSPVTLTSYIWESLGNPIPSSIYGASSDVTPPSAPTGLSAQ